MPAEWPGGRREEDTERASRLALREFLHDEAAGGVVLLLAAAVALVWANSGAADSYVEFWHHVLTLGRGSWAVSEDLQHWVNDGLMVIFFFVVGLEIKRELVVGELRRPRAAALPALAAVGGVLLPAVLYLLIAPGGDAARGWGIPMATDIAFAVGILALLGRAASSGAKLLLLSIAIVDDLIAILVIAIFYSDSISWGWLAVAAGGLLVVVAMRSFVASPWPYVVPAFVVWLGMLESGIHPTLAGVLLGLLTPARPVRGRHVLEQLEHRLHPISAFVVVPVVRAGERRHQPAWRSPRGRCRTSRHVGSGCWSGGRKDRRRGGNCVRDAAPGRGRAASRDADARGVTCSRAVRHRIYRCAVHRRPRVLRPRASPARQGRHLRWVDRRGHPRCSVVAPDFHS